MNQIHFEHLLEQRFVYNMSVFTFTATVSDQVPNRGNWISAKIGLNGEIGY